ncbi:hypothetical protein AVEN_107323-1 [Araneus ventricosus]|uniref:RNase H type-1 domain-containing protein n=1 Tax=Araneus ventricosus TaxID=182803 RepID=A0A4Y2JUP2_ARAVE|nr:hypothetical protein AVEN_107323-1 [Araneus ventricosus]
MVALREAMSWLSQESLEKSNIHTDSQSYLKALAALQSNSTISRETLNIWSSSKTEVVISWVKGHLGVLGNEVADQLERQGTYGSTLNINIDLPKSCLKKISKSVSLKSGRINGTFRKLDGEPSFSYFKSLNEPHSTQEPTNSSQKMGRSRPISTGSVYVHTIDAFAVLKVIQTTTQQSAQRQKPFISRSPVLKSFGRGVKLLSKTKDLFHDS